MLRILVAGDFFMKKEVLRKSLERHLIEVDRELNFIMLDWPFRFEERPHPRIREYAGFSEDLAKHMKGVHILIVHIAPVTAEVMDASGELKVIGCSRGGPVNVDIEAATKRGIPVINTPGRNADAVADFTIGLIICGARNIARGYEALKRGIWRSDLYSYDLCGPELAGKTLGVIGLGAVGRKVVSRAKALQMRVVAYDPYVPDAIMKELGIEPMNLDILLRESDFVSIHARLTPETKDMIGAKEISLMKRTAYLINTARGKLIDEKALYEALKNGQIAGAALDVYVSEPLPKDHPFLKLDNIILTPHIAGAARDVAHRAAEMIAKDIKRVLSGEKPQHCLNPEVLKQE